MELASDRRGDGPAGDGASSTPAPDVRCGWPRVVVMTPGGATVDVTAAASDLLRWARRSAGADDGTPHLCRPEWAALCRHVEQCRGGCPLGEPAPHPSSLDAPNPAAALTPREAQVVEQLRLGRSNKEIARALGVKEDTVKKHLQAAYAKLGVHRRTQVALAAPR